MNQPYRSQQNQSTFGRAPARTQAQIDAGLRKYMLGIYNYMASGVLLTGVLALLTYTTPALYTLLYQVSPEGYIVGQTGLGLIVMFSPLALVLVLSFGVNRLSSGAAQSLFWVYSALMGLSLSSIFFLYTGTSIAKVFFISASMFGALSLFGYTTKKNLTGLGTFMFMGLIGIIIASVVNIFLASSMMSFIISIVGVVVFAGLTAYDNQKLRQMYYVTPEGEAQKKLMIMGALNLYLDFINLFLMLLRLFGSRE
ncbi:MAG: Bax inhibitor-1/YccA family protein [Sphingomonadales bacterium]|jgi:FtsH-binding integral membrane protein